MADTQRIVLSANENKGHVHADAGAVRQETADRVSDLLMENHEQFHTYFFGSALHNHIVHHLLAIYALGGSPQEAQKGYDVNSAYQQPAIKHAPEVWRELEAPGEFEKRMGDAKSYQDFVKFFQAELERKGVEKTINEYIFKSDERADDMMARLFGGFLHPLIHLGYALEFNQPLLVAEALGSIAVHGNAGFKDVFIPAEKAAAGREREPDRTLLSIIEELRGDPIVSTAVRWEDAPNRLTSGLLPRAGDKVVQYLSRFTVTPEELPRKTAEMINTCIYMTAAAQQPGKIPMVDFFLMHTVTTSIFFSTILKQDWIPDAGKCRLLEWKARIDLAVYAACRTPRLYPERVFNYQPRKEGDWASIFRRATSYKDDGHTAKLIRAVKNGEEVTRPYVGQPGFPVPPQAFLKIAHMIMDSVERMDEPDYQTPTPLEYYQGMNKEVVRVTVRWVRWCGLDQAWDNVPATSGNAML